MVWATLAIVAGIGLLSLGLTVVEFRKLVPNAFRCTHCGHEFRRAPHRPFPPTCPRCHARDWARR